MRPTRSLPRRVLFRKKGGKLGGSAGLMDDLFDTPALRVLRALAREGPMNQRRFTEVSRNAPRHSFTLREKMEAAGYITVNEKPVRRITTSIQIEITPKGRKMAELSIAQEELDERGKRNK